jgi:hypothetical protein
MKMEKYNHMIKKKSENSNIIEKNCSSKNKKLKLKKKKKRTEVYFFHSKTTIENSLFLSLSLYLSLSLFFPKLSVKFTK